MRRLILGLCLFSAACGSQSSNSPTAPSSSATITATHTQPDTAGGRPIEITFTKWVEQPPAFTGFTGGDVVGTLVANVLRSTPFDNGAIVQLEARYEVTGPNGHSFTALVQGKRNTETAMAVLNGVITKDWLVGAQVQVTFERIAPCESQAKPVCFQGTIRIMPGSAG